MDQNPVPDRSRRGTNGLANEINIRARRAALRNTLSTVCELANGLETILIYSIYFYHNVSQNKSFSMYFIMSELRTLFHFL